MEDSKYILTMLVDNEPGVTARITGLFAARGYNIETICGAPTANPAMSRITITTWASAHQLDQIMKQIRRLTNVIKLRDMTGHEAVKRELAMVCVKVSPATRKEVQDIIGRYGADVIDDGHEQIIVQKVGEDGVIDALLKELEPYKIKKLARSGVLALYREMDQG